MATAAQNINTGDNQPIKRNPKHLTVRFATDVEHVSKVYPKEKHPNLLGAAERAAVAAATATAVFEARSFFGLPRKASSLTSLATRAGFIDFASGGDSSKDQSTILIISLQIIF